MNTDPSKFTLRLDGPPLIQYSGYPGAKIQDLHRHLDVVKDFAPDLVILVIGTNDLCDQEPATVLYLLQNLIDRMLHELKNHNYADPTQDTSISANSSQGEHFGLQSKCGPF